MAEQATIVDQDGRLVGRVHYIPLRNTFVNLLFSPKNVGAIREPDGHGVAAGSCGDTIEFFLRLAGDRILVASFVTYGCAATNAVASAVTLMARDHTLEEARRLTAEEVIEALPGIPDDHEHCARLAVNALEDAVADAEERLGVPHG